MSVRKLGPKNYEVRWRDGGRGSRSHARRFTTKDAADRFDSQVKERKRLGTLAEIDAGQETLDDFAAVWVRVHALPRLAPSTRQRYAEIWDLHISPRIGDLMLREISPEVVEDLRAAMYSARVGEPTIRKALYILQSVMRIAVRRRRIAANPVVLVEKPVSKSRRVVPLPPLTIEAIRADLGMRDATLVSVMGYGMARPFEAIRLEWPDVGKRALRLVDTKRKTERTVRMLQSLAQDLAEYQLHCGRPTKGLVFPRRDGALWTDTDYRNWRRRVYRPAATAAGLEDPRPYDLRHSGVSLLIWEGKTIAEVAEESGHSVEECARTYVHAFKEYDPAERVSAEEAIRRARGEVAERRSA